MIGWLLISILLDGTIYRRAAVLLRSFLFGFLFSISLLLSFQVILGQVAVLTHTTGVMWPVQMLTSISFLVFSSPMIAVMAHVLCIVLSVSVWTLVNLSSFSFGRTQHVVKVLAFFQLIMIVCIGLDFILWLHIFVWSSNFGDVIIQLGFGWHNRNRLYFIFRLLFTA